MVLANAPRAEPVKAGMKFQQGLGQHHQPCQHILALRRGEDHDAGEPDLDGQLRPHILVIAIQ